MERKFNRSIRLLILSVTALSFLASIYLVVRLLPHFSWLGVVIKAVLVPLFISIVIAYLLNPIVQLLHARGVPRGIAVVIIYFSFSLFLVVFLMNAIPAFLRQSKDLTEHIPQLVHTYQSWLAEINTHKYQLPEGIRIGIDHALNQFQKKTSIIFAGLIGGAGGILQKMVSWLIIPFIVFYLLKDSAMIQKSFLLFVPRSKRKEASKILYDIDEALGNYIGGQLIVCAIVGTLAYIGYWFIGMPYALILAVIIIITNIIPYIGPLIGAAPSILVALTISWKMTILVVFVNLIIQVLEGNLISPIIMGKRLHMHPLLIIVALLVGGEIGGLIGLIFAVPIVAILRVIIQHIVQHLVKH